MLLSRLTLSFKNFHVCHVSMHGHLLYLTMGKDLEKLILLDGNFKGFSTNTKCGWSSGSICDSSANDLVSNAEIIGPLVVLSTMRASEFKVM